MEQLITHVIFYLFAAIAVISAFLVITQNNPVRCVLFLVLTFFASSVLWILAQAEFLALILVLVYVGAVMTLFLFVVMMLNIDIESKNSHFLRYVPFGLIIVSLFVGLLMVALPKGSFQSASTANAVLIASKPALSNTEALGMVLYTDYLLAFELAAVILLVAIISAITLVHRARTSAKRQDIVKQIMTNPKERLVLLNMPSESEGK